MGSIGYVRVVYNIVYVDCVVCDGYGDICVSLVLDELNIIGYNEYSGWIV